MRRVNLAAPDLEYDDADPDGYHSGMFRLGPLVGGDRLGATLYELPPGQALCPYHYEHGEEEWLLVLDGRASVRHPEGTEELAPMDVVCFPRGPQGAHQVRNDGADTVRVLMWSEVAYPAVSVYPDSDKIGVWTQDRADNVIVERSSGVDYWRGEGGDGDAQSS